MRVVNTTDKNFEFQFNSVVYTVLANQVSPDWPFDVAMHGIKRSVINDPEEGFPIGHKLEPLDSVKGDEKKMAEVLLYKCPLAETEDCNEGPFKTMAQLRIHLEQHFAEAAKNDPLEPSTQATSSRRGR